MVERVDCQPPFHPRLLDFASNYGFVPRVAGLPQTLDRCREEYIVELPHSANFAQL